ncbi:MAG: hypothetical protein HY378_00320 [Candidatus Brennerbacteria bacterium]|nr:hypothetical protein [Candidatus Brennerbacteria bacterium]
MRFKKIFIVILVLAALGGGLYFIFNRPGKSSAEKNPLIELFSEEPKRLVDGGVESVKEEIREKGKSILSFLKESAGGAIDSVQEKAGLGKSDAGEAAVSGGSSITVLPVAKAGVKSYFLLSNPEPEREVQYEIDWGDGSVEEGILSGESETVSHEWKEKGEFLVSFRTKGAGSVAESIKVLVTE